MIVLQVLLGCLFYLCFVVLRRAKSSRKQYVREANAKINVKVKSKDSQKKLDNAQKKLSEYEKREVSVMSLRRAANSAKLRANQLQQEMKSLITERDRAVERFVIREEYLIVLLIVCSICVLLFCAGLKVQENNTCARQMQK